MNLQAEFSWKVKPKLPQQFKQAEAGGVPFSVILGGDELAQGKVKIKKNGLPEGHPEKDGVLVEKANLVNEVRRRLKGESEPSQTNGETDGVVPELAEQVEQVKVQDRDDVPGEPPVIPTVT